MFGKSLTLLFFLIVPAIAQKTQTHEELVVRKTYAALTALAASGPPVNAPASFTDKPPNPAPTFEITNVSVGLIQDIANHKWITCFSVPDHGVVLIGHSKQKSVGQDGQPDMYWRELHVEWGVNNSYTPERIDMMRTGTVAQAVAAGKTDWTGHPATYTRYATFDVLVTFLGRTVPYTASFFFGTDDGTGAEVVAPQDAVAGSGQLLWEAVAQVQDRLTAIR